MAAISSPPPRAERAVAVAVRAAARLHLGFLDPSGSLGRRFGGVGVVIDGFGADVDIAFAATDAVLADGAAAAGVAECAAAHLHRLREKTGRHQALELRLRRVLPSHAGFGSGTQLALAIGRAFAQLHRLDVPTATLARCLGRGLRSGIGIAGFDHGGLIVDGGPLASGAPAPVIARIALPSPWRVIVVQDEQQLGLSGAEERDAIAALAPLARAEAAEICHQVLMRVLPGAAGAEFETFAAGVNRLQVLLGEHFAPAQAGSAWTSASVGRLLRWMQSHADGEIAIGQSSWGPTGFAFAPTAAAAQAVVDAATEARMIDPGLSLRVVAGRNAGASVTEHPLR